MDIRYPKWTPGPGLTRSENATRPPEDPPAGTTRRFLQNLSYLTAGDLAAKAAAFLAFAHIARVAGTELFGDYGFAVAFTLYFRLIVSQGLDIYGIQDVARDRSLIPVYSANIIGLRLVSCLIGGTALIASIMLINKTPHVKLLLLFCGLGLILEAFSAQWVFQATEQMKLVAIANVLGQSTFSILVLSLFHHPGRFLWIPIMQISGETVGAVYLLIHFRKRFGPIRVAFDVKKWRGILKFSLPIGLTSFLSMMMFSFDLVLLGFLKPSSDVGQYSAAYKIVGFFLSLTILYNRNLFPTVARCKGEPARLTRIGQSTQKYVLLLTLPLAAGGSYLSTPLIKLIFGPEFAGGAAALAILIWIIPFAASRVLFRVTLLSHGFQNANFWISLTAVMVNVLLNLLLIPRFSYVGSAAGALSAEVLLFFMAYGFTTRKVALLPLVSPFWKPALASVIMIFFVSLVANAGVVVAIGVGFISYLIAALFLGAFKIHELRDLIALCRGQRA